MSRKSAALTIFILGLALGAAFLLLRPRDPLAGGLSAYSRADWPAASSVARSVLETDKNNTEALRLLARASARQGRDDSAEAIYRRLGGKALDSEDLFLLGRGLLREGRSEPGLAALGAARDLDPDHAETLDALARHSRKSGALLDALAFAERLARQDGWKARALILIGSLKLSLFNPAEALSALQQAVDLDPDLKGADLTPVEAKKQIAKALLELGKGEEARPWLSGANRDPEADWLLSRASLQSKDLKGADEALKASGEFVTSDPLRHDPSPYVGSAKCAGCHPKEYRAEQSSEHALGLVKGPALYDLPWPSSPIVDAENANVSQTVARWDLKIVMQTQVDRELFTAVVEYALGSNHLGQTFVGRDATGAARELRLSRYPTEPLWAKTNEHPKTPPDAAGFLGRPVSEEALRQCLHCHSTNFRSVQAPKERPEALDRGIGCERCHGPAGNHLLAVELGFKDLAIAQPSKANRGAATLPLCAQCHKSPGSANPDDPSFIRFQAPTFMKSRCYTESEGAFSCISCHNPHTNVSHDTQAYEAKCLECHSAVKEGAKSAKICKVNSKTDCLSCHMPKVSNAVPRAVFTDHFIRVRP